MTFILITATISLFRCDKGARDKFFCAAHGGGKRCKQAGCNKSAVGGSNLCTSHGGGRRCAVEGCQKSAQSSTKFCVKHGGGKNVRMKDVKRSQEEEPNFVQVTVEVSDANSMGVLV